MEEDYRRSEEHDGAPTHEGGAKDGPSANFTEAQKPRRLSAKASALIAAAIAIACFAAYMAITTMGGSATSSTVLTETELEKTVNVSKLATSRCVYRGIAEKTDNEGNVLYHVYYESTVEASINIEDISFTVNEADKTVTPTLPDPVIESPVVDTNSIEFFERDASGDMKEEITLCKQDAIEKVVSNTAIQDRAKQNLRSTVEALTKPILEREGYRLSWDAATAEEDSNAE